MTSLGNRHAIRQVACEVSALVPDFKDKESAKAPSLETDFLIVVGHQAVDCAALFLGWSSSAGIAGRLLVGRQLFAVLRGG